MYKSGTRNIGYDPITIDASVYANEFTESKIELYYYEEPTYDKPNIDEAPANNEVQIVSLSDLKGNDLAKLLKHGNFTCRYKADDGRVAYT